MRRVIFILAMLLMVACSEQPTTNNAIVITPETESLVVDAVGGEYTLRYTINNPISGAPLVVSSSAEWITDIDTSTGGVIRFYALCNDTSEPREATLTLRYPEAESYPEVLVSQTEIAGEQITITLTDVDFSECTAQISVSNAEMPYIVMMAEMSYFENSGITDTESLIEADKSYFYSLMAEGGTLEEFLAKSNIERRGECTQRWQSLSPAKEYVVYSYGISVKGDNYRRTTPVYHCVISSRLPERNAVAFDVDIAVEGPGVCVDVAPVEWDGYYMVQFVEDSEAGFIPEGEPFTEANEVALAESFFYVADHLYYFDELSAEEVMQRLGYRGVNRIEKTLNAAHTYMVLTYAVASAEGGVPMVVSHPVVDYFTTGDVVLSSMTFEVEITNIRPRSVDIAITPSVDEPYTAVMMYASNLPDGSNEEQLQYIIEHYAPLEMVGRYEEHVDQLPPATEFVLAVYGFYAGAPTTELFVYRFATKADGVGGNVITEVRCSAYDLAEVVALEPYYTSYLQYADYFLSVEVFTAEPSPTLHFDIFSRAVVEEYGLEAVRDSLLEYSYTSSPDWALCSYGNEYIICGLAEDSDGFVGELFVSDPVSFSREETDDAAIFVGLYKEYTTP